MAKEQIIKSLQKITGIKDINLEFPGNETHGDYSSNIALIHKDLNPEEIVQKFNNLNLDIEAKVVGKFINFWLKNDVLINNLIDIETEKSNYGKSKINNKKLAIIEYSSPNIAKPFGVGHLRSTIIGDAIANLLEFSGWKVMRDNHLGDWGTQFGKQIYAIKEWSSVKEIESSLNPVKKLVELYVKFHKEAEKDPSLEDKARLWFKKLEDGDTEAKKIWKKCVDWSYQEFDKIYKILNIKFSSEFENGRGLGESFFESQMAGIIDELKNKKLLKEGKERAQLVFFAEDKYPPAMILKKDGATLYHTRDLATDKYRLEKYKPDLVINEVGSEQTLYFRQLFEIEKLLGWYKEGQRIHISHGLIRFKDSKMSTRKGNIIWMEDLLTEAVKRAKDLGSESEIAQIVAVGALKYNDLKRDSKTEIIFDWDEILNMEGNSGPYLQYTIARTNSVLGKIPNSKSQILNKLQISKIKFQNEEFSVLRKLSQFSEIIEMATKNYSPNILCSYLYELAQKFNSFYNAHKIIESDNVEFRILLTSGVGQVLKNGLKILGIEAPERM